MMLFITKSCVMGCWGHKDVEGKRTVYVWQVQ